MVACGAAKKPAPQDAPPADPQTETDMGVREMAATPSPPPERLVAPEGARNDVAERAPGGEFIASDGKKVDLGSVIAKQGVVLVFYRGHWCKPCRAQLKELEAIRTRLEKRGFTIYAVSTDEPATAAELRKSLGLGFTLLSDPGGMSINGWGVYTREHDLARPSVFVVAPGGRIAYRYVSDTPVDRPTSPVILDEAAKAMPRE